jgi:hypothetical protein
MAIVAKIAENVALPPIGVKPNLYELFDDANPVDAIGLDGNIVQVKRSIGVHNEDNLRRQIAGLQAKLDAITTFKASVEEIKP